MPSFCIATQKYIEGTDINYRKSKGQYFTPKEIRDHLLRNLPKDIKEPKVLDPGCGTGEFLLSAKNYFYNPKLYGWDIDAKLIDITKQLVPEAILKETDALKEKSLDKFDFVIGNPPYYEFKPDDFVRARFSSIINGRVNIFGLFILLGLELLKDGGYLAYVLPPSMNNGAYFSNLRKHIIDNTNIEYLKILEGKNLFHKALQTVMILVLKKTKNRGDYLFKKNGITIFTEKTDYLKKEFQDSYSLKDLGFSVKTGTVVWNKNKERLTNRENGTILLIWAHNIKDNKLVLCKDERKPQYIKISNYDEGPAIVVNRITGTVSKIKIKAAFIPKGMKFVGENHINIINIDESRLSLFPDIPKVSLKKVYEQLISSRTVKIMERITGNTQISKTEWERLFPIKA